MHEDSPKRRHQHLLYKIPQPRQQNSKNNNHELPTPSLRYHALKMTCSLPAHNQYRNPTHSKPPHPPEEAPVANIHGPISGQHRILSSVRSETIINCQPNTQVEWAARPIGRKRLCILRLHVPLHNMSGVLCFFSGETNGHEKAPMQLGKRHNPSYFYFFTAGIPVAFPCRGAHVSLGPRGL